MSISLFILANKLVNLSITEILLVFIVFALIVMLILYWYIKLTRQKTQMIELLKAQNTSTLKVHNDLKEAKEKAEESDRLKTYFLANVSHEIRTPLNAIMGFSSLLQDGTLTVEERNQFISLIHDNSNKLLDVMNEIFDIAQIESGIVTLQFEPCQINSLLMNLSSQFNIEKMLIGKEHINIRVRKGNKDSTFSILTDEHKLKQALVNLIENALKYTIEGNIEFGYDLIEDRKVQFFVKDSGLGFQQEKLNVLFERFRQFDEGHNRNFGGIGLGLTLSKKFVELLDGEMWAESTLGKGSTFYFTIPYKPGKN